MSIDENLIRELLLGTGNIYEDDLVGCTDTEIDGYFGIDSCLPKSYRAFLRVIGHSAGDFLLGTDAFFRNLPSIKNEARLLLLESGVDPEIISGALIFYMHQGYEFGFFYFQDVDDPPVYQYIEGDDAPKIAWSSFSSFFLDLVKIFADQKKGHNPY